VLQLNFDAHKCDVCKTQACLVRCQYLDLDREAAKSEIGKIIRGEDSFVLDACVGCYACEEYCPMGNHPFYFIVERQEEKGVLAAPRAVTSMMLDQMEPRGKFTVGTIEAKALSFCFLSELQFLATGRLFDSIRSSYIFGREFACPAYGLHYGKASVVKERLPRVIENIERLGIRELICMHDECYATFKSLAPAYGLEPNFEPIHYFEYLYGKLKELEAELRPLKIKAAYQRPCSARLHPETDHLVDDIFELIGVERVEREYDRENALCCGTTIRSNKGFDLGDDVQKRNADDMVKAGAEYCVFNCPACQIGLEENVGRRGIRLIHMVDICKLAIGEEPVTGE
jgi:Fe-S oxidoreductase